MFKLPMQLHMPPVKQVLPAEKSEEEKKEGGEKESTSYKDAVDKSNKVLSSEGL